MRTYNQGLEAAANLHRKELLRLEEMMTNSDNAAARVKRTNAWAEARSLLKFGIEREKTWIKEIESLKEE